MKRYFNFIFITLSLFLLSAAVLSAKEKDSSESEVRLKKITKIIQDYKNKGEDFNNKEVINNILKEISTEFVLEPKDTLDNRSFQDLREEANQTAAKKYPDSIDQVKKKLAAEAEKKFAMAKSMDRVTVQFKQGNKIYTAEGIFYSYGGNSVQVDSQYIAIYDLLPEYRIKFDKTFNDQKRKEYMNNSIRDYSLEKATYFSELIKKLREKQAEKNEKAGYIFAYKEWRTAKRIAELLIDSMKDETVKNPTKNIVAAQAIPSKETAPASAEKTENVSGTAVAASVPETKTTASKATALEDAKKKASDRLNQIANTYAGIDADQGYKMLLWGMTREETELLLSEKNTNEKETVSASEEDFVQRSGTDNIVLEYSQGPLAQVELYFAQNLLYKVTVRFRILSTSVMQKLVAMLNERYGLTDEQKKIKEDEEKNKSVDDAEKMTDVPPENLEAAKKAASEKGTKDKKADKKKDNAALQIPLEQKFHWTGSVTNAFVVIKINQERTAYTEFTLVKECPTVVEQMKNAAKQQELMIKEMQKKKELEELHKKKIDF